MPGRGAAGSFNDQVLDEASEWFVELNDGEVDAQTRERFGQWLRRSPEHVHAFLNVSAAWSDADVLARTRESIPELEEMAASEGAVVRMPEREVRRLGTYRRRWWKGMAIAAGIAGVSICAAALLWLQTMGYTSYAAEVGERRSIVLADGSTLDLNSRSRVRVRYTQASRSVELIEGQALFHVAKDAARPFVVSSAGTKVRAVGTAFDVYQKRDDTIVTVVEGRVEVSEGAAKQRASAGERVVAADDVVAKPERADVPAATAWTQRKVVVDSMPLHEVIDELNRYRTRPLVLNDEHLRDYHISGEFSSTNATGFLQFLEHRFAVEIVETETQVRIEPRR